MKILIGFALLFTLVSSCKDQKEAKKTESSEVKEYSDLIGYKLICKHKEGEAHAFLYSPHILAIWSLDKKYMTEYFRTVNVDAKSQSIFFESTMYGTWDLKTKVLAPDTPDNRRIKLEMDEGELFLTVVPRLESGTRKPIDAQAFLCERGDKIKFYWADNPDRKDLKKPKN